MENRTAVDAQGNSHELEHLHTDLKGREWWGFVHPLRMPAQRATSAELAAEWANLNMGKEDLQAYIDKMKADGNAGLIVEMFKTLGYMEERLKWACDGRSLLELAKCYFLVDDEPVDGMTEKHNAIKEDAWATDPGCRAFFLHRSFLVTKGFSAFSEVVTHDFFKAQETLLSMMKPGGPINDAPRSDTARSRTLFMSGGKTSTHKPS